MPAPMSKCLVGTERPASKEEHAPAMRWPNRTRAALPLDPDAKSHLLFDEKYYSQWPSMVGHCIDLGTVQNYRSSGAWGTMDVGDVSVGFCRHYGRTRTVVHSLPYQGTARWKRSLKRP